MLNYKKPIKVKSKLMENEQVTIAPADTKTQVIKAGNKTIGTVSNPTVANQLKTAIQKGEVNLAQDLKETAPKDQEQWVKDNKEKFIKQYGKKGEAILYATAWQRHNDGVKESKLNESLDRVTFDAVKQTALEVLKKYGYKGKIVLSGASIRAKVLSGPIDIPTEYLESGEHRTHRDLKNAKSVTDITPFAITDFNLASIGNWASPLLGKFLKELDKALKSKHQSRETGAGELSTSNYSTTIEIGDISARKPYQPMVKESKRSELDKIFESVAFDEPDPVSHILSKFKFEVNQFCQGQQINPDLYDCLYDYYLDAGLMPYGVAKARDANPIEWVSSKLKEYLGQCGVSQQTSKPLDSRSEAQNEQPVPEYGDDVEQQVSSEPTEQEIDQMFESILGKPLTSKIKESKMKVTQPKRKQVAESSIDRKSKLMEAVDPKSVYIVVKNVPRLKDIRCDIGITYDMRFDPESESFSALNLKLVDMETGQKYSQKQVMMDTLRKLLAIAQKDASDRAEKNDLFHDDFDEDGIPLPVVSGILKNSKTVTFDYVRVAKSLAESSIDRKARQLVDSWNLKLKQKLDEKEAPPGSVFKVRITYKSPSGGYASAFVRVPANNSEIAKKYVQTHVKKPELRVASATLDKTTNVAKMFGSSSEAMQDLKETTHKRKLKEGVSISTSQSQGFGYDEIDGNTSINVCATGEDAIRLAEILRDAGFGQFKLDHIAVPQKTIVGDYHDDAGEVQQPEYDPMPEYDETQAEADYEADHIEGDDESQLLDRIKQFVSYGAETPVEEITEAEDMGDSEVVVYNGKLGIVVDADTGADNEYEVMFADGTEVISGTDLEPATQAQINASKDIVKYVGDDAQFAGRYGVIIEEDGDEYHVAFSDGETWIVGTDLEAPALQESFANEYQMNEPAQTSYMTHGISGGLNSLRRSQATGNVTRISTMESKGKGRKMLKESKQAVGKPSDELASMANLVEAISVQQRIKFGG